MFNSTKGVKIEYLATEYGEYKLQILTTTISSNCPRYMPFPFTRIVPVVGPKLKSTSPFISVYFSSVNPLVPQKVH